jgi:hypothetical protein
MDGGVELQTFGRCQKVDEALGRFPGFPNGWRVPWVEKPSNFRDCTGSEPSNIGKYQQGIVFQNWLFLFDETIQRTVYGRVCVPLTLISDSVKGVQHIIWLQLQHTGIVGLVVDCWSEDLVRFIRGIKRSTVPCYGGAFRTGPGCTRAEVHRVTAASCHSNPQTCFQEDSYFVSLCVCLYKWVHTQPLYIAIEVSIWSQVVKCVLRFFKATDGKAQNYQTPKTDDSPYIKDSVKIPCRRRDPT